MSITSTTTSKDGNGKTTYYLTRILFLRALSAIYFVAFLIAFDQNEGLLGDDGLLPANKYFLRLKNYAASTGRTTPLECFQQFPTLLWFIDFEGFHISYYLQKFALVGMSLSILVFFHGSSNAIVMSMLWIIYFSIDTLGQTWYSFGWESQLLETGFIAIFLVPPLAFHNPAADIRHMKVAIYAYWWLIFRIMIGAGLIKIRGDQCWRDLTCMNYHYETQPVPNPLSYYLHHNYEGFHQFETMVNHIVELVTPWFMFFGRKLRLTNAIIQITFQIILILSGNLSFLNWLTLLPSLTFLDDAFLLHNFRSFWSDSNRKMVAKIKASDNDDSSSKSSRIQNINWILKSFKSLSFATLVAYLSIPVVKNLMALDGQQAMNRSFQNFKLVNTYGAFGSITKKRTEVILQGTLDDIQSSFYKENPSKIKWHEYEFKCKPGSIDRRPCIISPYHYRLDWLMWFAAFGDYKQHPWLIHLIAKLLSKQTEKYKHVHELISYNPFNSTHPPKWIRAEHYQYQFTELFSKDKSWWTRKRIGTYLPPVSLDHQFFRQFGQHYGLEMPHF